MQSPKVLFINSDKRLLYASRFVTELSDVGFRISTVSSPFSLSRRLLPTSNHYRYLRYAPARGIAKAINTYNPDLIVCSDDRAVYATLDLHHAIATNQDPVSRRMARTIEESFGDPLDFQFLRQKSNLVALAQAMALRCPRTETVDIGSMHAKLRSAVYPIVVKADETCGGHGVCIAANEQKARAAILELSGTQSWMTTFTQACREMSRRALIRRFHNLHGQLTLQQHIIGQPANIAVACWKGRSHRCGLCQGARSITDEWRCVCHSVHRAFRNEVDGRSVGAPFASFGVLRF